MVTVPAVFNVTTPVLAPTVAIAVLLLLYVTAAELALEAVTVNGRSVTFLVVGGFANASIVVPCATVSVLLVLVAALYWFVSACVALKDTSPTPTKVTNVPEGSTVATFVLLLLYVIAPLLLLVGLVENEKEASPSVLLEATENDAAERVDVPRATVKVLLVLVEALYWFVCACVALNDTSPAPTRVTVVPDASTVATEVLLLLYVIAPLLLLVGLEENEKEASPNVLFEATANDAAESVDVPRATVKMLLVLIPLAYWIVAACVALKETSPAPTTVIKLPDKSIVATFVLLLLYVITPLLLLVGRGGVMPNDGSPNVFDDATVKVDDENVDAILP
jgi:uncharacterized membrane protein